MGTVEQMSGWWETFDAKKAAVSLTAARGEEKLEKLVRFLRSWKEQT